jgi:hypothetical protein
MPDENSEKMVEDLTEDELEEMLADGFKYKEKPKHRGLGKYERRGIYRGPDVKKD